MASIGARLKELRKALGLSQRDFGTGMYLSQSYYAQIEGEKREAPERILEFVSAKYNVSKNWLKDGAGEMFGGEPPDAGLSQLVAIYQELGPFFRRHALLQVKQLLDIQKKARGAEF
jgi:transcriptional regulator with XRE-family HTH domain